MQRGLGGEWGRFVNCYYTSTLSTDNVGKNGANGKMVAIAVESHIHC